MTRVSDEQRTKEFLRILGDELRAVRKQHGWIREELRDRLPSYLSLQTIATYELGKRHCSVARLLELTEALDVSIMDVLSRTLTRLDNRPPTEGLYIDLTNAARIAQANFEPLRRWAYCRIVHSAEPVTTILIDPVALGRLAELCGTDTTDLIGQLISMGVGTPCSYRTSALSSGHSEAAE